MGESRSEIVEIIEEILGHWDWETYDEEIFLFWDSVFYYYFVRLSRNPNHHSLWLLFFEVEGKEAPQNQNELLIIRAGHWRFVVFGESVREKDRGMLRQVALAERVANFCSFSVSFFGVLYMSQVGPRIP